MKSVLCTLLVGMTLGFSSEESLAVNVRGVSSCGTWVKERQQNRAFQQQSWMVGYLSGLATAYNKEFWGNPNVNYLDNQSVFLWVENYCMRNPLKDTDDAADVLFAERIKGM